MDDEAKQLLREIRDLFAQTIAENGRWQSEMRSRMLQADRGRRIIAGVVFVAVCAAMLVWGISSMSPRQPDKPTIRIPGTDAP
jgi:CHASE3 domain sensor protein